MSERTPNPLPGPEEAGELLDQLLDPLLDDFTLWFARGTVLLDHCPESVMPLGERTALAGELDQASRALAAARALRAAAPVSMALDLQTMAPWHRLVLRCWALAAELRKAGVQVPPLDVGG